MRAVHVMSSGWMFMLHGAVSAGWDVQAGPRGGHDFVSTNWLMAMAQHAALGGDLALRTMLSLEPATIRHFGFPLLLQSGETLHDRQHPHDLFMEVALDWRRPLNDWLGVELYGGPAGEPALGPVAFMHRASAQDDPFPPLGHHWQDATHISFGVATAALYTSAMKLEASWFNGREPDNDNRWDLDLRRFDSASVRLQAIPDEHVAVQVSYGSLPAMSRVTASVQVSADLGDVTAVWGRNLEPEALDSFLLEGRLALGGGNTPFARLERVDKTAADLGRPRPRRRRELHRARSGARLRPPLRAARPGAAGARPARLARVRAVVALVDLRRRRRAGAADLLPAAAANDVIRGGRMTLIDLSHAVEHGMQTYPGLPGPVICDFLSREASRAKYAPGTEFHIGRIDMVANTGTYVDAPFHRFADGADLSQLPLERLADLEIVVVRHGEEFGDVRGKAVLVLTGWSRHFGTPQYFQGHPFLTLRDAESLLGAAFVGIDSLNIDDIRDGSRPVHTTLLGAGIPVGEHFTNLHLLPACGARLHAAPVKVKAFGTFPVRAYAVVP